MKDLWLEGGNFDVSPYQGRSGEVFHLKRVHGP